MRKNLTLILVVRTSKNIVLNAQGNFVRQFPRKNVF